MNQDQNQNPNQGQNYNPAFLTCGFINDRNEFFIERQLTGLCCNCANCCYRPKLSVGVVYEKDGKIIQPGLCLSQLGTKDNCSKCGTSVPCSSSDPNEFRNERPKLSMGVVYGQQKQPYHTSVNSQNPYFTSTDSPLIFSPPLPKKSKSIKVPFPYGGEGESHSGDCGSGDWFSPPKNTGIIYDGPMTPEGVLKLQEEQASTAKSLERNSAYSLPASETKIKQKKKKQKVAPEPDPCWTETFLD